MLKPAEPAMLPGNGNDRPIGELVHQLAEQGKTYAMAELDVAKATAASKAQSLKVPAFLLGTAFLLLQAAFCVLGVAVLLALLPLMGPLLAGFVAFLIFAGLAGGLAFVAVRQIGGDS